MVNAVWSIDTGSFKANQLEVKVSVSCQHYLLILQYNLVVFQFCKSRTAYGIFDVSIKAIHR